MRHGHTAIVELLQSRGDAAAGYVEVDGGSPLSATAATVSAGAGAGADAGAPTIVRVGITGVRVGTMLPLRQL